MKSKYIQCIGVLLMAWISTASAQTNDTKYFRCLSGNGQDLSGLFFTQSELPQQPTADNPNPVPDSHFKEEQLRIPSRVPSGLYSYNPTKPLKIIRHIENKITLVSSLDMQQAAQLTLLFLVPGKDAATMDVRVIDDGLDAFPGGAVEVFNDSHIAVKMTLETTSGIQTIQLNPGDSKVNRLTFEPNTTTIVSIWVPGKSDPAFSTSWDMFSSIRYMAFIVDGPSDKASIRCTRFPDNAANLQAELQLLEKTKH